MVNRLNQDTVWAQCNGLIGPTFLVLQLWLKSSLPGIPWKTRQYSCQAAEQKELASRSLLSISMVTKIQDIGQFPMRMFTSAITAAHDALPLSPNCAGQIYRRPFLGSAPWQHQYLGPRHHRIEPCQIDRQSGAA